MTADSAFKIIIAGGKTGGHLFPGIAVAQAILRLEPEADILFVGTDTPFEIETLSALGFAHQSISARPVKGGSITAKARAMVMLLVSIFQAMGIVRSFKPAIVLGVGGFSSFAVVLAARVLGIATAIQEQNAMPGMTNRMLSRFSRTIFTSFKQTIGFENHPNVIVSGNPVRRQDTSVTQEKSDRPDKSVKALDNQTTRKDSARPTLLVTGGSQGAASINTAFTEAVALMANNKTTGYKIPYTIIHQTGQREEEIIAARYQALGVPATVKAFFTDMPQRQAQADLMIARSGAGTVFEICAHAVPAILVPYPYAADDHQFHNAMALKNQGAALVIEDRGLSGPVLKEAIETLLSDPAKRSGMKDALKKLAIARCR